MSRLSSSRVGFALLGIAALALALFVGFNLERAERTVRIGPSGEARANPLLAAERLFGRLGWPAHSTSRLDELPAMDHLLVLAVEDRVSTQERARRLADWIYAGGHLVVGPQLTGGVVTAETTRDPLLELLGVEVVEIEHDSEAEDRETVPIGITAEHEPLQLRFLTGHALRITDGADEETYSMVWDDHGQGRYYVIRDLGFLRNEEIGELDHARFLGELIRFGAPRAGVLLVHGETRGTLLGLILRHGWLALLAAGACIGTALWHGGARFGPLLAPAPRGSRSVLEHVDATGQFLWSHGRQDVLLRDARRAVQETLAARRPHVTRGDEGSSARALSRVAGLSAEAVQAALFGACPHRRDEFLRRIRTLDTLRRCM